MKTKWCYFDNALIRAKIECGEFKTINKRSRSRVWNIFSRIVDDNGIELKHVICRTCPSVFRFNGCTSNLVRHKCYKDAMEGVFPKRKKIIKRAPSSNDKVHKEEQEEVQEYSEEPEDLTDEQNSLGPIADDETKERLAQTITEWIVEDCRAIDITEDSGLKKFAMQLLEIGANFGSNINVTELLPAAATISANIESSYQDTLDKVRFDICAAKTNGYSMTCASWTDKYLKNTHICLTIHYLKDAIISGRVLTISSLVEDSYTDAELKAHIENILRDFHCDLEEDNPTIVTPIGSRMADVFGERQVYCINNLLNNVINQTFNEVSSLRNMLSQANELMKYLRKSGTLFSLENQLISYCPTKWNSIFYTLSSIETNWIDIFDLCGGEGGLDSIGNFKIDEICAIAKILGHFEKCCTILEDETSPTLHLVIPHIHRLKKVCLTTSKTEIETDLKQSLLTKLERAVERQINKFHKMAMYFFPPTNQLLQCSQAEKHQTIEECKALMKRFCSLESDNSIGEIHIKQEMELDDDLFSDFVTSPTTEDRIAKEINRYSDIQVTLCDGYDVLNWWYSNKDNFPLLYQISCRILSTPATSAPSGKIFEEARNLITNTNYNQALHDDTANKIIFLHSNA